MGTWRWDPREEEEDGPEFHRVGLTSDGVAEIISLYHDRWRKAEEALHLHLSSLGNKYHLPSGVGVTKSMVVLEIKLP